MLNAKGFNFGDLKWDKMKKWLSEQENIQKEQVMQRILQIEKEEKYLQQNVTDQCVDCRVHITSCGCEWSIEYFDFVRADWEKYKLFMKNYESLEKGEVM